MGRFTHCFVLTLGVFLASYAFANQAPVVDSFAASPPTVLPGATASLTLNAHDPDCSGTCTTGCGLYIRQDLTLWSAAGGTLQSINNGTSSSPYTAAAQWIAPIVEGNYTISVQISDSGTSFGCGGRQTTTAVLIVQVTTIVNQPPVIASLTANPDQVYVGGTSSLVASASDPDGDPITYSWSTTLGSVQPTGTGTAQYFAPAGSAGVAIITCTVTDPQGATASMGANVAVVDAMADKSIAAGLTLPLRIAADSHGYLFVADPRAGGLVVVNFTSERVAQVLPVSNVSSVAVDWDERLLVGTSSGALLLNRDGSILQSFASVSPNLAVSDVAVDVSRRQYYLLYGDADTVTALNASGSPLFSFGANGNGAGQFRGAASIAVLPDGSIAVADNGHGLVHLFDSSGQFQRSFGGLGSAVGKFTQLQGVTSDPSGLIYASDSFQSRVQVFNADGSLREVLGQYGSDVGRFITPLGLTVSSDFRKLIVASLNNSSLQVFNLQGSITPPVNTAPTVPVPSLPVGGTLLPWGSNVKLAALNSKDPDYQALQYEFELYFDDAAAPVLVNRATIAEGYGVTAARLGVLGSGNYLWRVRAFDGIAYSGWSANEVFAVDFKPLNRKPGVPVLKTPIQSVQTQEVAPALVVENAVDPDGDALVYFFEAAQFIEGQYVTMTASPAVTAGNGVTSWQLPCGVLERSLKVYWRSRTFDGALFGDWSAYEAFWTEPFPASYPSSLGNIPDGDTTRPEEVRYQMGPVSADTVVSFQVFDITRDGELIVTVNGQQAQSVSAQTPGIWSPTVSILLPSTLFVTPGPNVISFVHSDAIDTWGVSKMSAPAVTAGAGGAIGAPGVPKLLSPAKGSETDSTTPTLTVGNTTDPNGDPLTYVFEAALYLDNKHIPVAVSPLVQEGSGTTSWQVPCGAIEVSQRIYWRARAFDGVNYGMWSKYRTFWSAPAPLPASQTFGNYGNGDRTRRKEVRYVLGPQITSVTLQFQVYDVTSSVELKLLVNGQYTHAIAAQVADGWSTVTLTIPASELNAGSSNSLHFIHHSRKEEWGIRNVLILGGAP